MLQVGAAGIDGWMDGHKVYRPMKSAEGCSCLQTDISVVQKWCFGNYMDLSTIKTNVNFFSPKANNTHFNYCIGDALIFHSGYVKDLGVILDMKPHCKLYDCIFSGSEASGAPSSVFFFGWPQGYIL
jgi:hypothetical protein